MGSIWILWDKQVINRWYLIHFWVNYILVNAHVWLQEILKPTDYDCMIMVEEGCDMFQNILSYNIYHISILQCLLVLHRDDSQNCVVRVHGFDLHFVNFSGMFPLSGWPILWDSRFGIAIRKLLSRTLLHSRSVFCYPYWWNDRRYLPTWKLLPSWVYSWWVGRNQIVINSKLERNCIT